MKWQEASKLLIGQVTIIGLFVVLFMLSGVNYTHSGDKVCDGLECEAYVNVTTSYWNFEFEHLSPNQMIYLPEDLEDFTGPLRRYNVSDLNFTPVLYKKSRRGRKLWVNLDGVDRIMNIDHPIPVDWLVPARGKGNWRPIKEGDTWNRLKINENKLIGHPTDGKIIKWSFELGEISIDPRWISYKNVYKNESNKIPIYSEEIIEVEPEYNPENQTWSQGYNYTERTIVGYKTEYYDGLRIGTKAGGKYFPNSNVVKNRIYVCKYSVGDRNWIEYPERKYEIDKGVCKWVNLLEI